MNACNRYTRVIFLITRNQTSMKVLICVKCGYTKKKLIENLKKCKFALEFKNCKNTQTKSVFI